jgi:hypothetical protein
MKTRSKGRILRPEEVCGSSAGKHWSRAVFTRNIHAMGLYEERIVIDYTSLESIMFSQYPSKYP